MAGFFGLFDYNKEGPGVYANGPEYGPFKTFFAILGRKFWKTIQINLLFVLLSLPAIAIAILLGTYVFPAILPFMRLDYIQNLLSANGELLTTGDADVATTASMVFLQLNVVLAVALVGLQMVVCGPVQAGINYLFRNFAKEEHVFIWFDFKEQAKKNIKQSIITSLISIVVFIIFCVNIWSYSNGNIFSNEILNGVLTAVFVTMLVIFTMMQMYIYPMMVTFKLSISQLYKNALLMTLAKLPSNLGIFILTLLLTLVIPLAAVFFLGTLGIIICLFYYIFLGFGFSLLLSNFHVYRQIKKYMIDPILKEEQRKKNAERAAEEDKEEEKELPIFKDTNTKNAD